MAKRGCNNGCIHNKEIKLPEMRENYMFRCDALNCYMKAENVKQSCRLYQSQYKVTLRTVEDFLRD